MQQGKLFYKKINTEATPAAFNIWLTVRSWILFLNVLSNDYNGNTVDVLGRKYVFDPCQNS